MLFVVAVISGGSKDSAGRGRRRLEVHYRLKTNSGSERSCHRLLMKCLICLFSLLTHLKCHIRPDAGFTLAGLIMFATVS